MSFSCWRGLFAQALRYPYSVVEEEPDEIYVPELCESGYMYRKGESA